MDARYFFAAARDGGPLNFFFARPAAVKTAAGRILWAGRGGR